MHEFLTDGYAATTIDAIAERAGFTKGAVYSNFGGKPELFAAVCTANYRTTSDAVAAESFTRLHRADDRALHDVAVTLADSVVANVRWHVLLDEFRALSGRDQQVAAVYRALRHERCADLADRLRRSGLRDDDHVGAGTSTDPYDVLAILVLGTMSHLALEYVAGSDEPEHELITAAFDELLSGWLR